MKIVAISDTHGQHRQITRSDIPDGDVLIHAGDFTRHGDIHELEDFLDWFKDLPHEHKLFTAGNHDTCMENYTHSTGKIPNKRKQERIKKLLSDHWYNDGIQYLHNEGKTINGVTFCGLPYSNTLKGWSFNTSDKNTENPWSYIFDDTNVLITHGPPHGLNDYIGETWGHIGDKKLREKVEELKELKLHIYGHNHSTHGKAEGHPRSINASILDEDYNIEDNAIEVTI